MNRVKAIRGGYDFVGTIAAKHLASDDGVYVRFIIPWEGIVSSAWADLLEVEMVYAVAEIVRQLAGQGYDSFEDVVWRGWTLFCDPNDLNFSAAPGWDGQ